MGRYFLTTSDGASEVVHVCDAPDDVEARRLILTKFAREIIGARTTEVHSEDGRLIWAR